jgi:hypothetical protein
MCCGARQPGPVPSGTQRQVEPAAEIRTALAGPLRHPLTHACSPFQGGNRGSTPRAGTPPLLWADATAGLLTDDTASKVTAAAQAAVPGATIQPVETDAEGSP